MKALISLLSIVSINFRANKDILLSEAISLMSSSYSVNSLDEKSTLDLEFNKIVSEGLAIEHIAPNPFSDFTQIVVNSKEK